MACVFDAPKDAIVVVISRQIQKNRARRQ